LNDNGCFVQFRQLFLKVIKCLTFLLQMLAYTFISPLYGKVEKLCVIYELPKLAKDVDISLL